MATDASTRREATDLDERESRLDHATRAFLGEQHGAFIAGSSVVGNGRQQDDTDPATGRPIARVKWAAPEDIDRAVAAAKAAFPAWSVLAPAKRARLMDRWADVVESWAQTFAELETLDTGKPIREARNDVARAVDGLRFYAGCARQIRGETIQVDAGSTVSTVRRPIGVVAAIVPWNFPLALGVCKVAPALAAGSTVVAKPSELTPLTALLLARAATEAGLPRGVLNVVCGDGPSVGEPLAMHPEVACVTFTGSTRVGRLLGRAAGEQLRRLALELGGKSPVVLCADADLDDAVEGAASAIFYGQGEVCSAGSRLLVADAIYDEVVAGLIERAEALRPGDPLQDDTTYGALISQEHLRRVLKRLHVGLREPGTELLAGGRALTLPGPLAGGSFMAPTVVAATEPTCLVEQEELFGPVVTVSRFLTLDDAIARANGTPYGLAAGVWTGELATARRMSAELDAGMVWINGSYNRFDSAVPFGGVKASGNAREWSHHALDTYLELKTVWESA